MKKEKPEVIDGYNEFVGAFSMFTAEISDFDLLGFEHVVEDLDFDYEPLLISTQVVAGENLKFIANATSKKSPRWFLAEIDIFRSLKGEFSLIKVGVVEVDFNFLTK